MKSVVCALLVAVCVGCSSSTPTPAVQGSAGTSGAPSSSAGAGGSSGALAQSGAAGVGTAGSAGAAQGGSAGSVGGAVGVAGVAGVAGASGSTGNADAGSGCAGKSYKLCEDFEAGTLGGVPSGWTTLKGYGSAQGAGLAADQAHSGSMALKSNSMTPGQARVQKSLSALGATASTHWGRLFYKVQSPAPKPANGVIHVTFAALEGTTENRVVDTVEDSKGAHQWLFNIPDDSCCTASTYDWKFDDAWHCAEWYVNVNAKSYRFFSDGKEVPSLAFTGNANSKMSNYTSLALGTIFYQMPPTPFIVWFDDLALDDTQIGCD